MSSHHEKQNGDEDISPAQRVNREDELYDICPFYGFQALKVDGELDYSKPLPQDNAKVLYIRAGIYTPGSEEVEKLIIEAKQRGATHIAIGMADHWQVKDIRPMKGAKAPAKGGE